jgi:hypothetical protein
MEQVWDGLKEGGEGLKSRSPFGMTNKKGKDKQERQYEDENNGKLRRARTKAGVKE